MRSRHHLLVYFAILVLLNFTNAFARVGQSDVDNTRCPSRYFDVGVCEPSDSTQCLQEAMEDFNRYQNSVLCTMWNSANPELIREAREGTISEPEAKGKLRANGPQILWPGGTPGPVSCVVPMFHGITGTPQFFQGMAEDFTNRGCAVLNMSLAGHGGHPDVLGRTRYQDWVADAKMAYEMARKISPNVHCVGHSTGGALWAYANSKGFVNCQSLLLFDPPLRFVGKGASDIRQACTMSQGTTGAVAKVFDVRYVSDALSYLSGGVFGDSADEVAGRRNETVLQQKNQYCGVETPMPLYLRRFPLNGLCQLNKLVQQLDYDKFLTTLQTPTKIFASHDGEVGEYLSPLDYKRLAIINPSLVEVERTRPMPHALMTIKECYRGYQASNQYREMMDSSMDWIRRRSPHQALPDSEDGNDGDDFQMAHGPFMQEGSAL